MQRAKMVELVELYFAAVDTENFDALRALLGEDCVFSVETHDVALRGTDAIAGMFDRLWKDHAGVRHQDFKHVSDPEENRIASRFTVVNTEHDGTLTYKSNCNFFELVGDRFSRISVYMAGANTLHDA